MGAASFPSGANLCKDKWVRAHRRKNENLENIAKFLLYSHPHCKNLSPIRQAHLPRVCSGSTPVFHSDKDKFLEGAWQKCGDKRKSVEDVFLMDGAGFYYRDISFKMTCIFIREFVGMSL